MKQDDMQIEILEDGSIRTSTDGVSAVNHQNAEAFLRFVAQMTGGTTTRTRRKDAHHHHRGHNHDHDHDHDHHGDHHHH